MPTNNDKGVPTLKGEQVTRLLGISKRLRPLEAAIAAKTPQVRTTVKVGNSPVEAESRSITDAWLSVSGSNIDKVDDANLKALITATNAAVAAENMRRDELVAEMGLEDIATGALLKKAHKEGRKAVRLIGGGKSVRKTERLVVPEDAAVLVIRAMTDAAFNRTGVVPPAYAEASAEVRAIVDSDKDTEFVLQTIRTFSA